ncbi:hypothetical protein REH81_10680, partial [Vibrio rotiferianus]
ETACSYSSSVTISYVYSIFVEKNAKSVEVCVYSFANSMKSWLATNSHCSPIVNRPKTVPFD